jgi:biotin carboxylase
MNRTSSVMILGAGLMQLPAIRSARARGWRTIVADANRLAPGADLADVFEHVDLKDRAGLLACARRHRNEAGLDGVFTAGTDFSASVAWLAENLGLPGISYQTALDASDKGRMRACFARHAVPHPEFDVYDERSLDRVGDSRRRFPVVVKPVDNMGARGVEKVDRLADLPAACAAALELSGSRRVIVEEFIEGPEFSIDALVQAGQLTICGVADRHIFFPPHFVELGHTMPSALDPDSLAELCAVFARGVQALGITHGAAKGDMFLSARGAVVGEIAARLSGGYMSGWTYPYSSGVDLTGAGLDLAVGLAPGDLSPRRSWTSAERAFISIPGQVEELRGVEAARAIAGVRDVFLRVGPGDRVDFPRNNVQKCGNIISAAGERAAAIAAAEGGAAAMLIRLKPGDARTAGFIFSAGGDGRNWFRPEREFPAVQGGLPWALVGEPGPGGVGDGSGFADGRALGPFRLLGRLPDEFARIEDWNHRELGASLQQLESMYAGGRLPGFSGRLALGGVFWHALLRGGLQAAVWLLDTLYAAGSAQSVKELLGSWKKQTGY